MTPDRFRFEGSHGLSDLLKAQTAASLSGQLDFAGGMGSLASLYREQESVATRMAILSQTRGLRSEAESVAKYLQGRASSVIDAYLETERKRVLASAQSVAAMSAEAALARDSAINKAIKALTDASTTNGMLGGLSLAEYTWELLQKEQLAQQRDSIFARQADLAALDRLNSELYARYRSSEFSADYHSIEEIQAEYGLGNADDESTTIEVADAQSRAIEVVAKDIANSPANFWRGKTEEQRIALLGIYLALIFGLMDQLRWHLDRIEQQREAAELAKEKVVLEERHREVVDVSERLRRALDVLAGQALEEDVYVVGTRPTTVRARPGSGLVLGTAYTNQQVLVTGKSSRWLKVRFRDHLEQRDIEGWVLKHYLQPLKERAGP
ncbi:SH3 domain-containing protein [Stenotrophomonas acidaminiphila]|uniref:SH3 domain-containing protein n=1 Tax=Stenotrophomonas acidaminiphila TaxID=128780 RepID=UPI001FAFA004|nr:SH3 domain-containing protein [Stenotrophomonas acidaminiphila]